MKKTAATMILLAGMGGGCVSPSGTTTTGTGREFNKAYHAKDVKGVSGPTGEPVTQAGAKVPVKRADSGVVQAGGVMPNSTDSMIQQTAGFSRVGGGSGSSCSSCGGTGGGSAGCDTCGSGRVGLFSRLGNRHDGGAGYGVGAPAHPGGLNWGAVAYGAPGGYGMMGGMGGGMGGMYANQRTAIKFVAPQGMQISWFAQGSYAEPGLSTPSAYNFAQGGIYRLRVRGIPNRPGKVYYPTLDVYGSTPKTVTFLSHNTVPVGFTDEDFDQVNAGNMVVKVIYLPDPAYQELSTVAGAEELVSTKLLPGEDPLAEAQRRGTILAVIRLGNIDLENPNSPPMSGAMPGGMMPTPGMPMGAPMPGAPANVPQAMPGNAAVSIPPIPTAAKPTAPISTGTRGGFNR